MNTKELYKISKRIYREGILHSQLQSAGSNQARFLERIQKDKITRMPDKILKVISSVYIAILTLIPLQAFLNIFGASTVGIKDSWILFVGGLSVGGYFLFQPCILLVFSITFIWGLMSGGPYEWIHTLPLSKKDVQKIGLFSFLRSMNLQLIVMALTLPVGVFLSLVMGLSAEIGLLNSLFLIIFSLIISLLSTLFNLSIVVIVGRKMAILMEEREENTKRTNFVRIGTMVLYFVFSSLTSYIIQIAMNQIPQLYAQSALDTVVVSFLNVLFAFIVFPFSSAYILTTFAIGLSSASVYILIASLFGLFFFILLTYFTFKKALQTLQNITSTDFRKETGDSKEITLEDVEITKHSKVKAFYKRDIAITTREMGSMMIIILPLMMPISSAIMAPIGASVVNSAGITENLLFTFFYLIIIVYATIIGITNIETGGETITSSLPIIARDQVKAKIPFFTTFPPAAFLVSSLFYIGQPNFWNILLISAIFIITIPILGLAGLFLKVFMFGKMKHKYVLEEINNSKKITKYLLLFIFLTSIMIIFVLSTWIGLWLVLVEEAFFSIVLIFVFNYMFPKYKGKSKREKNKNDS